jgi:hypothetical protein
VFDFAALDVAFGLILVYLLLSLICTAANETLSSLLALRAKTLKEGIANLLGSDQARQDFYDHPLVAGLIRHNARSVFGRRKTKARYPSYIPGHVFALAITDKVVGPTPTTAQARREAAQRIRDAIDELPEPAGKALEVLWNRAGGNIDGFQDSVERWYDDAMSRVSGWYRRKVQVFLWVLAILVSVGLHADSIEIAQALWKDDAARAAVVARAEQLAEEEQVPDSGTEASKAYLEETDELGIPIGWADSFPKGDRLHDAWIILINAVGLGMTAVALTLGAPFWFDLLKKVANIRAAGKAPSEKPVEKPAEAGEPSARARGS